MIHSNYKLFTKIIESYATNIGIHLLNFTITFIHRYIIYTRWCIPHCGQANIEAGSQALVVPTEFTRSMIICVFCIAEMDKANNKSSFIQLESIQYTNAAK